jgi:hypothetical protein
VGYGIRVGALLGPEGAIFGGLVGLTFGIVSAAIIIFEKDKTYEREL